MPASRAVLAAIDELGLNHRKAHKSLRASDHKVETDVHVEAPAVEVVVAATVEQAVVPQEPAVVVEPTKDEAQLELPSVETETVSEEKQASKKKGKKPVTD